MPNITYLVDSEVGQPHTAIIAGRSHF